MTGTVPPLGNACSENNSNALLPSPVLHFSLMCGPAGVNNNMVNEPMVCVDSAGGHFCDDKGQKSIISGNSGKHSWNWATDALIQADRVFFCKGSESIIVSVGPLQKQL